MEELSSDLCNLKNCAEEQKQAIEQLSEELEEASFRAARLAEVQEQVRHGYSIRGRGFILPKLKFNIHKRFSFPGNWSRMLN